VHSGKLGQVTNFTIVCSTAKLSVHGFVLLMFAEGRHCYAALATCYALPRISSFILSECADWWKGRFIQFAVAVTSHGVVSSKETTTVQQTPMPKVIRRQAASRRRVLVNRTLQVSPTCTRNQFMVRRIHRTHRSHQCSLWRQ